jgi:hypothetical protein
MKFACIYIHTLNFSNAFAGPVTQLTDRGFDTPALQTDAEDVRSLISFTE